MGRKKGIGVITISQRPQHINNTVLTQCEHFFFFALNPPDAEYMRTWVGNEIADRLVRLPKWHKIYWSVESPNPVLIDPNGNIIETFGIDKPEETEQKEDVNGVSGQGIGTEGTSP